MAIHTVLGPIEPDLLGPTSMHEHLFADARVWSAPPREEPPANPRVCPENLGFVRWNMLALEDNLLLDDPELAAAEAARVKDAGGSGLVDLTLPGMGRRVEDVVAVARRTGLHVMVGCGWYVHDTHPPHVETATVDALAEEIVGELEVGIGATGVRAALIGEIGTSDPITARERKVLHAAGAAAARTGAAVNVHLDPHPAVRNAHASIEILLGEGVPADRIVISHMDERLDLDYHRAVAETGVVLEYDTWGSEFYWGEGLKDPTDQERMEHAAALIADGLGDRLTFGCDVWTKGHLRAYGGMGYDHLLRRIVPSLRAGFGVDDATLEQILVHTPRRLLDR